MNEELKIIISAEIDQLRKEVDSAKKQIDKFSKDSTKGAKGFGEGMKKAGAAAKTAMKAAAIGVAAVGAAIVGLSESTEEYRRNQAKLNTAFETAGSSAEVATQTYNELYRVLGDDDVAVEAAGHLAQLTTNQEDLSEWTNICQGVYATFGDSLPIESLTEAANETAKSGELTGALTDALVWAGIAEDDFKASLLECNSEAEREALIRDTLNGVYSEAAEGYEKNAASILAANEAQAKLNDALAQLGELATPIVTILKEGLANTLAELAPHLALVGEGLQDIVNGVEGGAERMSESVSNLLLTIVDKIVAALPTIIEVGVQIVVALIEGIVQALPQIVAALLGALPMILQAIIQIIVSIAEGIAQMLPSIVQQIVDIIPVLIQALIDNIPVLLQAAITLLMAIVDAIPVVIKGLVSALPALIDSLLDTLLDCIPELLDAAVELFNAIVDAIPEIIPVIVDALPKIITSIIDALVAAMPMLQEGTLKMLMAIVQSIPKIVPHIAKAIPQIISGIVSALIKGIPQIIQGAIQMFMGIVQAIPKIIPELIKGLGSIVKGVKDNLVEKLKNLLKFKWELPKLKMPSISVEWKNSPAWLAEAAKFLGMKGIPSFKVNWNAMGGVFDKATLFNYGGSLQGLGENGAEAVVPLENNLEWLDKLATMLGSRMGSMPVVLQVDGKTFAQTSIRTINNLTKQTGKLGLVIT